MKTKILTFVLLLLLMGYISCAWSNDNLPSYNLDPLWKLDLVETGLEGLPEIKDPEQKEEAAEELLARWLELVLQADYECVKNEFPTNRSPDYPARLARVRERAIPVAEQLDRQISDSRLLCMHLTNLINTYRKILPHSERISQYQEFLKAPRFAGLDWIVDKAEQENRDGGQAADFDETFAQLVQQDGSREILLAYDLMLESGRLDEGRALLRKHQQALDKIEDLQSRLHRYQGLYIGAVRFDDLKYAKKLYDQMKDLQNRQHKRANHVLGPSDELTLCVTAYLQDGKYEKALEAVNQAQQSRRRPVEGKYRAEKTDIETDIEAGGEADGKAEIPPFYSLIDDPVDDSKGTDQNNDNQNEQDWQDGQDGEIAYCRTMIAQSQAVDLMATGRLKEAIAVLTAPGVPIREHADELVKLYLQTDQLDAALQLRPSLKSRDKKGAAYEALVTYWASKGDVGKTVEWIEKFNNRPKRFKLYLQAAAILSQPGASEENRGKAALFLDKAQQLPHDKMGFDDPEEVDRQFSFYLRLSVALFQAGQIQQAHQALEMAEKNIDSCMDFSWNHVDSRGVARPVVFPAPQKGYEKLAIQWRRLGDKEKAKQWAGKIADPDDRDQLRTRYLAVECIESGVGPTLKRVRENLPSMRQEISGENKKSFGLTSIALRLLEDIDSELSERKIYPEGDIYEDRAFDEYPSFFLYLYM